MSRLLRSGIISRGFGALCSLFSHTWNGDADIQSNKLELDGTGDCVQIADNDTDIEDVFVGSGDFTLEMNPETDLDQLQAFFGIGNGGAGWAVGFSDGHLFNISEYLGDIYVQWEKGNGTGQVVGAGSLSGGKSLIVVRQSGRISLYVAGTRLATTETSTTISKFATTGTTAIILGNTAVLDVPLNGRIDNIRISNIARYTATEATITPLTLSNDSDVVYLNTFTGANGATPTNNTCA